MEALTFIEQTKAHRFDQVGVARRVAVVGGGNTAIDVVTAARRLGAEEVYMNSRRGQEEMSAVDYEYELAKKDSVTFLWQSLPVRVFGNGHVEGVECVRTQAGAKDGGGRRSFTPVPGSEFRLDAGMFIKALGQNRKTGFLQQIANLELKNGCVVVAPETMQTGNPKYFAGAACVNGGGKVVGAVAQGNKAALRNDTMPTSMT